MVYYLLKLIQLKDLEVLGQEQFQTITFFNGILSFKSSNLPTEDNLLVNSSTFHLN